MKVDLRLSMILVAVAAGLMQARADVEITFDTDRLPQGVTVTEGSGDLVGTVPGVKGRALVVGGHRRRILSLGNHLRGSEGSILLWVQPVDWRASADTFQFLATLRKSGDVRYDDVMLYKSHSSPELTALRRTPERSPAAAAKPILSWRRGEWRQVAATWGAAGLNLYIDGKHVASHGAETHVDGLDELVLGIPYTNWAKLGDECTVVDSVQILDRQLTPAEVEARFTEASAESPHLADTMQRRRERMELWQKTNLALDTRGCVVFSSSFADTRAHYTDHVIDGDLDTAWRCFDDTLPQWLDMRWPYAVTFDRVVVRDVPPCEIQAVKLFAWHPQGTWQTVQTASADRDADGGFRIRLPTTRTARLRIVFEQVQAAPLHVAEVSVQGPDQPDIGQLQPYWKGWHVWYPEPDGTVKTTARFFRREFTIPPGQTIASAFIQLYTNDLYDIYINGNKVASGFKTLAPVAAGKHLRPGDNCIAIKATPTSQPGWPNMALAAELTVNRNTSKPLHVVTDASWKVGTEAVEGWLQPGFDDVNWATPLLIDRVGEGIWGKITYRDCTTSIPVAVNAVEVTPSHCRPGETVQVRLRLRASSPIPGNHVLIWTGGSPCLAPGYGDYVLFRRARLPVPPSVEWPASDDVEVTCDLVVPSYAPTGPLPLRLKGLATQAGLSGLSFVNGDGQPLDPICTVMVERPATGLEPGGPKEALRRPMDMRGRGGVPLLWAFHNPTHEKIAASAQTGLHVYQARAYPLKPDGTAGRVEQVLELLNQHMQAAVAVDPQARILVFFDLRPSSVWLEAHPEARLVTAFGEYGPQSYFSKEHEALVHDYLRTVIGRLQSGPYAPRIVGYHLMTCGTPDSALGGVESNVFQSDRSRVTVGDFNPQAVEALRAWLRQRYEGSEDALRAAWRQPQVTFQTAMPDIALLTAEGVKGGLFHDPAEGAMRSDVFEFLSGAMARFFLKLAATVRGVAGPERLVGCYFGYDIHALTGYNGIGQNVQNNNFDEQEMLASDAFDYLAMVPSYSHRLAGSHFEPQQALASMDLHGKQYLAELDTRTFTAVTSRWGRQRSRQESVAVLKRDVGEAVMHGHAAWFADWSTGGLRGVGYYSDEALLKTIERGRQIYEQSVAVPRTRRAEIAVIFSGRSWFYHDLYRAPPLYHNLVRRMLYNELPHIGAPYDIYRLEDLAEVLETESYRLVIMLNTFVLSDRQNETLAKLQGGNRTVLWFYAPGYVRQGQGLRTDGISDLTGIDVAVSFTPQRQAYTVTGEAHRFLPGVGEGHACRTEPFAYPRSQALHPIEFGPVFTVTDPDAVPIGVHPHGGVALALRQTDTWRSIYSAVPYMDRHLLRAMAAFSGVHLYTAAGPVVDARGSMLLIHKGFDEPETVRVTLPDGQTGPVRELFSGALMTPEANMLELTTPGCHTYLLRLSAE